MNVPEVRDGRVHFTAECEACGGSGLYVGLAERDGFAVVCRCCRGSGGVARSVRLFTGRKERADVCVTRVLEVNPGIVAGFVPGEGMGSFGGICVEAWRSGLGFPRGSEMREHVCPAWWFQSADCRLKPEWPECDDLRLGVRFTECPSFVLRAGCWQRWDREHPVSGGGGA